MFVRCVKLTRNIFLPSVNRCLQEEIGFGRYQIELFLLSGLGWLADSELPVNVCLFASDRMSLY